MRPIFADSFYWVALTNSRDAVHECALALARSLDHPRIITTEQVHRAAGQQTHYILRAGPPGGSMSRTFTLEYWLDEGWYVGRLREVPGVFSQGETLERLEENIQDAYRLMLQDSDDSTIKGVTSKEITVEA